MRGMKVRSRRSERCGFLFRQKEGGGGVFRFTDSRLWSVTNNTHRGTTIRKTDPWFVSSRLPLLFVILWHTNLPWFGKQNATGLCSRFAHRPSHASLNGDIYRSAIRMHNVCKFDSATILDVNTHHTTLKITIRQKTCYNPVCLSSRNKTLKIHEIRVKLSLIALRI